MCYDKFCRKLALNILEMDSFILTDFCHVLQLSYINKQHKNNVHSFLAQPNYSSPKCQFSSYQSKVKINNGHHL